MALPSGIQFDRAKSAKDRIGKLSKEFVPGGGNHLDDQIAPSNSHPPAARSFYSDLGSLPAAFPGSVAEQQGVAMGRWAYTSQTTSSDQWDSECRDGGATVQPVYDISRSNRGYQLLKKAGWNEAKGLGLTEQGRLRPLDSKLKKDKRGIGADASQEDSDARERRRRKLQKMLPLEEGQYEATEMPLSKKERKAFDAAIRKREQALARDLYREFLPDNV